MTTETIKPVSFKRFGGDFDGFSGDLGGSFARYGFAVIADHGLEQGLIDAAVSDAKAFFALPEDVKRQYHQPGTGGARGLTPFGVEAALLNAEPAASVDRNALVMIYRRELLEKVLASEGARDILSARGYAFPFESDACLEHLRRRFRFGFPHEIGLFLGYPPEDVRGFLEHRGAKSLAVGYWKVYGNVEKARRTFRRYRRAERDAARSLLNGGGFRL